MSERKISHECIAAETAILRARKKRVDAIRAVETKWADKLRSLYNSFPEDVTRGLLAMEIIEEADLDPDNVPRPA